MPTITLTDTSSLIVDATLLDNAVLGKSPSSVLHFLRADVIGALDQRLDQVQLNCVALGFNYSPAFTMAGGTATFTAGGGVTGSLDLFQPAKPDAKPGAEPGQSNSLFPKDQYGSSIDMKRNCYLALGFQLSLQVSLSDAPVAYTITPAAATQSSAKLYLPFAPSSAAAYPTLKEALVTLCQTYSLPSSLAQMLALPEGAVFVYDGQGKVSFNASFDLLTEVNPTATLGVSPTYGLIDVTAGPSITLGGGFCLTGEFQVRLWNKDGKTVQLGYYKKQGTTFSVTFDASAGADAAIGKFDIFSKIYGLLGSQGKLDPDWLSKNIPASVADDVEAAYEAAAQTNLSIAIDEECDTSLVDQVAFSWNFDTATIDAAGQSAFDHAIHGDLSPLMQAENLPPGVTKAGSVFDKLKSAKHTFSFNFLGLFDHASVEEAALKMTVKVSDDGQVVVTDAATLTRLDATVTPFVKSDLLRKVLAEDFVATVGYSSSLGHLAEKLDVKYSYYDYQRRAHTSDLATFVATAEILANTGDPEKDWAAMLQSGVSSQTASLLASLTYDNAAANRLFLSGGAPRSIADYEQVARQALALTPGLGLNSVFVSYLTNDAKWKQLVDSGARGNFFRLLGADEVDPPTWASAAYAWEQHILRWAPAMHRAAAALEQVLAYVAAKPDLNPLTDAEFTARRKTLASLLSAAVKAAPLFHDALGVVTIEQTAKPAGTQLNISYAGKTAAYA